MYRLIGSLELLGNPASFFSDVAGGVKQFYYEPRNGLVKSPAAFAHGIFSGTTGLASGVVGGTGNLLGGAANAAVAERELSSVRLTKSGCMVAYSGMSQSGHKYGHPTVGRKSSTDGTADACGSKARAAASVAGASSSPAPCSSQP